MQLNTYSDKINYKFNELKLLHQKLPDKSTLIFFVKV